MKIGFYRQEYRRVRALVDRLEEQMASPFMESLKSVVLCLRRSGVRFSLGQYKEIMEFVYEKLKEEVEEDWISLSVILRYYFVDFRELEEEARGVETVEEDQDLLGLGSDWQQVLEEDFGMSEEEWEEVIWKKLECGSRIWVEF